MRFIRILLGCILLYGCSKAALPPLPPSPVTVITVEPKTIPADFEYIGVAASSHIVQLRARVEGYLQKITYKEGGLVKEGDLMFQIDPRPFEASLAESEALLEKDKALLWNADQKVKRYRPLYAQNAISEKDLDDAISQQLALEAQVDAAKAGVYSAALNLGFTSITAPVTAMSDQAKYREGALISPGPDSLLTTLWVLDPIWVWFSVSEGDFLKGRKEIDNGRLVYPPDLNFSIDVELADESRIPAVGKVDFANPSYQQNTGTMNIRAILPNPKYLLRPGEFVRVIVKGAKRPDALFVPQTAVQQGRHGMYVFVVDSKHVAQMRDVEVGDWYKENWIITGGLEKGDLVVVDGVNRVHNGATVEVTKILTIDDIDKESSS